MAQFSPIMSMPSGSRAVSAAAISLPSSIAPVVSMVTWAMTSASAASRVIARLAPMMAALAWSRSWQVSMISASAPPRSRASALTW